MDTPKKLRIALCGPSGSGKTTLARKISELTGLHYRENSAGLLLSPEDKEFLVNQFGWTQSGHKDVIRLSMKNSGFAWEFQHRLLMTRKRFIEENESFIIDRSPVDNLTYFLSQSAIMVSQEKVVQFIKEAREAMKHLDALIFIPTMLTGEIEDNGSRIPMYEYQRLMTSNFKHVIETYFSDIDLKQITLNTSDFEERVKLVKALLEIIRKTINN